MGSSQVWQFIALGSCKFVMGCRSVSHPPQIDSGTVTRSFALKFGIYVCSVYVYVASCLEKNMFIEIKKTTGEECFLFSIDFLDSLICLIESDDIFV